MIEVTVLSQDLKDAEADLLAVGAFEGEPLGQLLRRDWGFINHVNEVCDKERFTAALDQQLLVHLPDFGCRRLLLVGLGNKDNYSPLLARRFGAEVARAANARHLTSAVVALPRGTVGETANLLAQGIALASYRFDRYRRQSDGPSLTDVKLLASDTKALRAGLARAQATSHAISAARDLVNEPAETMTPQAMADYARKMAKERGLECRVLGAKDCEKLGMGLYLAVARGSSQPPRLIHLIYRGTGRGRRALVGKGVTFDSGGLSLKPSTSMLDMKTDMAGAAAVIGAMSALPALGVEGEVHGIIAATENMISGDAYRLGDVYRGMNGTSVEIHNTDAEGRLTLADALAYALSFEPDELIDLATLTGACMIALGPRIAGVMGNNQRLVDRVLAAGQSTGEDLWQLPLPEHLKEMLKSDIADLKNVGERWGGALTAGLFLQSFVGDTPWVHIDIAGPSSASKAYEHVNKGGTGFGVATLLAYLTK
ncbi:MAG: leucyl aminopeptidase [Deltaproteobacteria bacterium]|nr:leucyl aminopeptidase [Deltaproteobacteria bacterium]